MEVTPHPLSEAKRALLRRGTVIPAHPLALDERRELDERRQRALTRYYLAAGAGGIAVGVHTTQFAIREAGLLEPVLRLAAEEADAAAAGTIMVAGVCGPTAQAVGEARLAAELGYDLVLVSMGGLGGWSEDALLERMQAVSAELPVVGFYLQPSVGGMTLGYGFWRRLAELPALEAIKIAPFDRYRTLDVVRAVCESGRRDQIALYTGNDDNIVADLLTPYRFVAGGEEVEVRMVGGLLGHWAVWTSRATSLLEQVHAAWESGSIPPDLLALGALVTASNAAVFDAANGFKGCIAGVHEVLRRQGLLAGTWCLDPEEGLSEGQAEEIDRICRTHPGLTDDDFVRAHLGAWLEAGR